MIAEGRASLILVRHGAALGAHGRCIGRTDLALSAEGRTAVEALARSWHGPPPSRIVTSDLARATATAAALGEAWGMTAGVDARLREMDFGDWDGHSWRELGEADGTRLDQWMANWTHERTPGGEGFPDVALRVADWLAEVRAVSVPGQSIVAVAHAGSIRALLCHLLGWTPMQAFRASVDHACATAVALTPRSESFAADLLYCNAGTFPRPTTPLSR